MPAYLHRCHRNVEPFATVAVKARVDGQILDVGFKEGEEVREGQVLFRSTRGPSSVALRQAEATHQRRTQRLPPRPARRRSATSSCSRRIYVSKDAYAQFRTNAETAEAVAAASRAAVENARLNLDYCTIRSPINGFAGKTLIQRGIPRQGERHGVAHRAQPGAAGLRELRRTGADLDAIRTYMTRGPLAVSALPPGSTHRADGGKLVFVDNAVDASTGTIRLRAQFVNQDLALWPGQFVNVAVTLYEQATAIVVPADAVQNGRRGNTCTSSTPTRLPSSAS